MKVEIRNTVYSKLGTVNWPVGTSTIQIHKLLIC